MRRGERIRGGEEGKKDGKKSWGGRAAAGRQVGQNAKQKETAHPRQKHHQNANAMPCHATVKNA